MGNDMKIVLAKNVRLSNKSPYSNTLTKGQIVDAALRKHLESEGLDVDTLLAQGLFEEVSVFVPDPVKGTVSTTDRGLIEADLRKMDDEALAVLAVEHGAEAGEDFEDREECIAYLLCKDLHPGGEDDPSGEAAGSPGQDGAGAGRKGSSDDGGSPSASEREEAATDKADQIVAAAHEKAAKIEAAAREKAEQAEADAAAEEVERQRIAAQEEADRLNKQDDDDSAGEEADAPEHEDDEDPEED